MKQYTQFFKTHGLNKTSHLMHPPIHTEALIELPISSLFHYLPETDELGPSQQFWLAKHAQRLVMVDHVEQLSSNAIYGNPRLISGSIESELREYHNRYRRLKRVKDLQRDSREPSTYVIVNYGLLNTRYRYRETFRAALDKNENLITTLIDQMNVYHERTHRHQFVDIQLEHALPTLKRLKRANTSMTREMIQYFTPIDLLFLLHFWQWLGEERQHSQLNDLKPETLNTINLRFIHQNRWVLINVGLFDQWRKDADDNGSFKPDALQKRLLMVLMELYSVEKETVVEEDDDDEIDPSQSPSKSTPQKTPTNETESDDDPPLSTILDQDEHNPELENTLNTFQTIEHDTKPTASKKQPLKRNPIEMGEGIQKAADRLAEEGTISASDYKRYQALAKVHTTLKDPYAKEGDNKAASLIDASTISEKELTIESPTQLAPMDGVVDQSMLETTTEQFDQRYIENVLKKDIIQEVMTLTNAGVAITDYQVDSHNSIVGDYDSHRITVQPVGGSQSTLNFKIPHIKKDGTFTINQIDYRLRKQRIDVPIRKVKPNRVALTSYYGKVFVTRNERRQYDYTQWLVKQIRQLYFDQDSQRVTQLKSGVGTESTIKTPRVYGILSQAFLTFHLDEYRFFLQYTKRHDHFGEQAVNDAEKQGGTVIGQIGRTLIVVDDEGVFYRAQSSTLEPIGTIEDLLNIPRKKAPIDYAELSVFSKKIPLGIVLAYYLGLETLVKSLPGHIQRVQSNTRVDLDDTVFQLKFNDELWLVSREDPFTTLIMGGWQVYAKTIASMNVSDFNHHDIYYNLLEPYAIGVRHLNELSLLNELFIDSITRNVLESMKEPTEWVALLNRATELLLTEHAPNETDMEAMRIAGYERVAGAVYRELIQSMREYRGKQGNARAKIELKPYAVWQGIVTGDASRILVESSNPIKNINEREAVTFLGTGGRSRDTMVARTRIFNESDMGVISESTVDSGDVAVNTYLSANPNLTSLRGITKPYDPKNIKASSMLSTGALLSPASDTDDPKRVNVGPF